MTIMQEFSPVPSEHYSTVCHLLAGIARTCDHGTVEQYLGFLAEDAVFEFPAFPDLGIDATTVRGHAEIRDGVITRRENGAAGPGTHTLHLISTVNAWTLDENTVRGVAFYSYYVETNKVPILRSMGQYDNVFTKINGIWLLSHRKISAV